MRKTQRKVVTLEVDTRLTNADLRSTLRSLIDAEFRDDDGPNTSVIQVQVNAVK